jgi:hypothetical protein
MRPFVLAPQTKKLLASTQKAGERQAIRRPSIGRSETFVGLSSGLLLPVGM